MNSTEIAMAEPIQKTRAGRRARQKRMAANRSRTYRQKLREEGLPTARDVDAALAEAVSFLRRYALIVGGRPKIDLGDLVVVSSLILKRNGKKKRPSVDAIGNRIALQDEHRQPQWMPSMYPADSLLPPEGDQRWTDEDLGQLKDATDRHFPKRTPSRPESEDTPVTPSNAITQG